MGTKHRISISTAILLLSSAPALADGNRAYLQQDGDFNSATITQSLGTTNTVGDDGLGESVSQQGDGNQLVIIQGGKRNTIGNARFDQITDASLTTNSVLNNVQIQQRSSGNKIGSILQDITQQDFNSSTSGVNSIDVLQARRAAPNPNLDDGNVRNGNTVSELIQTGAGNSIDVDQEGKKLRVGLVSQTAGNDNSAILQQTGARNRISNVVQEGSDNSVNLSIAGKNNGRKPARFRDNFAGAVNNENIVPNETLTGDRTVWNQYLRTSSIEQRGNGNVLKGLIDDSTSKNNQYAIAQGQTGASGDNYIDFLLEGKGNRLSVVQGFNDNFVDTVTIVGNSNLLGIVQTESSNSASASVTGSNNKARIIQIGSDHRATLAVNGDNNPITIDVAGLENEFIIDLNGSYSSINIDINGEENHIFGSATNARDNEVIISQVGRENGVNYTQNGPNQKLQIWQ
jgi:hypothetical protein